jgi:phytoene dehydrogenase-like protein
MKRYDDIVVGSGISGLTMALILGMNGRKVLLLEKNPRIGGSVARFYKKGIPFDIGFHFTGGLQEGGILHDMLSALGIHDLLQPLFLSEDHANCVFIESENRQYEFPSNSLIEPANTDLSAADVRRRFYIFRRNVERTDKKSCVKNFIMRICDVLRGKA